MIPSRFQLRAALALALGLTGTACTDIPTEPPVDPQSIHLSASSTQEDWNLFTALSDWIREQAMSVLYDDPWTNWYKDSFVLGLAKVYVMRSILAENNLFHSYPDYVRTGYPSIFVGCPASKQSVRQVDGRCNDPDDPLMGAVGTRFGHTVPLDEVVAETNTLLDPNPREISRRVLARHDFQEVPFLNLLATSWIQFMTHDWFSHGPNQTANPILVPLASDDPLRLDHGLVSLPVQRTMRDPSRRVYDAGLPVTYVNEVTHWWDLSQIYGSDQATADRLRTRSNGRLRIGADGRLPLAPDGVEDTGFKRNWWLGLSMMHHLWVEEHNAIAAMLKARYPNMSDQRVYDVARLVNSALQAKIHATEWTPAILPNEALLKLEDLGGSWGNIPIFGVIGNPRDLHDVAFSLPEEFVSVYRMHPLMPESIEVRPIGSAAVTEVISVAATRDARSHTYTDRIAMDDLVHSFGVSHPGALVLNNFPQFLQDLELPDGTIVDMGTIDILRDRERGVPRYNQFRRLMQLRALDSFDQLTDDAEIVEQLEDLYDGDIEKLDLLVGMLAEAHRPTGFGFGETAFQVFTLIAVRRLEGDRFFTDLYDADHYTQEGLDWVANNTMKTVLLRHYPELASTGLAGVDNAFHPWE